MGHAKDFKPVKLICGFIFSRKEARDQALKLLVNKFGPVDLESPDYVFNFSSYYEPEMGTGLKRCFVSFEQLIRPESLPEIKLWTNELERKIQEQWASPGRPVNLDPGYLTASALIMATTKDFSHRIPLSQGIYAHLEFLFSKKGLKILDWTYPDFRPATYHDFFLKVRSRYLEQLKKILSE
jgi:hypothetical protein